MGIFGRLGGSMPYTNLQNLNLDWIIKTIKELSQEWATYHAEWDEWKDNTEAAFQSLHDYVMNYFENLDVSEEISEKINQMAANGTLAQIIKPFFDEYQADIDLLNARIDNLAQAITPGATSADAEIIDGRVSYDATTYDNLGEAIRSQTKVNNVDIMTNSGQTKVIGWTEGKYYNLDTSITTLDINNPDTDNQYYKCVAVPCKANDVFYLTTTGQNAARCWAFLKNASGANNIISRQSAGTDWKTDNTQIIAPANAQYVVFNARNDETAHIIKGETTINKVNNNNNKIIDCERKINDLVIETWNVEHDAYYNTSTGIKISYAGYSCSKELLPVNPKTIEGSVLRTLSPTTALYVLCYDENKTFINTIRASAGDWVKLSAVPEGTNYIAFSLTTDTDYFAVKIMEGDDVIEYPFQNKEYLYYTNRWCNGNGVIASVASVDMVVLPNVNAGDKWYTNTTGQIIFGFFDKNNEFLGEGTRQSIANHGTTFIAPEGAAYACIDIAHATTHGEQSSVFYKITKKEKILCLGDSITYLDGRSGYDGATLFLGFQKALQKAGYLTISNGYSGYCYATNVQDGSGNPVGSIYTKIVTEQMDVADYDYIILSAGSNDDLYAVEIGEIPQAYQNIEYDTDTMIGALGAIISYIRANNTECKIILATILKSQAPQRPYSESKMYAQAIREMANYTSSYLCDNYENYNVQPFTAGWTTYFYDSSHPNKKGMERLGALILKAVEQA